MIKTRNLYKLNSIERYSTGRNISKMINLNVVPRSKVKRQRQLRVRMENVLFSRNKKKASFSFFSKKSEAAIVLNNSRPKTGKSCTVLYAGEKKDEAAGIVRKISYPSRESLSPNAANTFTYLAIDFVRYICRLYNDRKLHVALRSVEILRRTKVTEICCNVQQLPLFYTSLNEI